MKSIVIFGGAGFVGKHIIRRLVNKGFKIIVPYQNPTNEAKLRILGSLGQIATFQFNKLDDPRILKVLETADICLNLKTAWDTKITGYDESILNFNDKLINIINKNQNIRQFIFFSGLGVDEKIKSARSAAILNTEKMIHSSCDNSIIIRPGVIVGLGDNFLSKLIPIIKNFYVIPIFGSGKNKFQPVFIDDVSLFVEKLISEEINGKHTFELAGPNIYSYKELYKNLSFDLNKKRIFIPIPMILAKIVVKIIEKTPFTPITSEQLLLFETDNLVSNKYKNFNFLSIIAQDTRAIIKKIAEK